MQVQAQGPLPVTEEAVPELHKFKVGAEQYDDPLAEPQAAGVTILEPQEAVVPPLEPVQVQDQGPDPVTADEVPELHKLAEGAVQLVVPLAVPQVPFTMAGFTVKLALQLPVPPDPVTVKVQFSVPDELYCDNQEPDVPTEAVPGTGPVQDKVAPEALADIQCAALPCPAVIELDEKYIEQVGGATYVQVLGAEH